MFRRKAGEPLHPDRLPLAYLQDMRATLGEARFATQYQQRPAPAGGGLVKEEWFQRYTKADLPPQFEEVIQSWDTANKVSEWADWTVCSTWGRLGQSIYLLHVHRERLLFPDLVRAVLRLAERFEPHVVLIEDHASGTQLLQVLREAGFGKGRAIKPVGDKEIRMTNQTALIESGRVWAPSDADWVQAYLRELVMFPNGRHDDQVDSTSQALAYLSSWLEGRGVYEFTRERVLRANPPPSQDQVYWLIRPPSPSHALTGATQDYRAGPDGLVWMPEYDGFAALRLGWLKVDEFLPKKD